MAPLRQGAAATEVETDQGLPSARRLRGRPRAGRAAIDDHAYGKYRHTMAWSRRATATGWRSSRPRSRAPASGSWSTMCLVQTPGSWRRRPARCEGTWNLVVEDDSGTHDVTFDAAEAETGWNSLGSFELADGEVRVVVSDETDGRLVVADAIRWVAVVRPEGRGGSMTCANDRCNGAVSRRCCRRSCPAARPSNQDQEIEFRVPVFAREVGDRDGRGPHRRHRLAARRRGRSRCGPTPAAR